ncbi:proline racemase family protein [Halopenitus sp. POP-27]|uniref:proline racemase family protein n=1 Tax=Halopenitus sp. POP-27 TaxID=2994425 RepID=UPI00246961D2|nr:proline racemase family protein [Halopenitus sp. POP-27]
MHTELLIEAVDTHTGGEPTRIVTGGLNTDRFAGGSVEEQRDRFREEADDVRTLLMKEPRGHDDMYGAILVPPAAEKADLGVFFVDNGGYKDMCGHGTMGVVTALIETGYLDPDGPVTLETPAGLVTADPELSTDGGVEHVTVENVSSYVLDSMTLSMDVDGDPVDVPVDVVYAGNVFAMVPASAFGMDVIPDNTATFVDYGVEVRERVNEAADFEDPFSGDRLVVDHTEFYEPRSGVDRNVVVFSAGSVDRSPCGTGTCGKMALLHSTGELDVGEPYRHESVIGTRFEGRLRDARRRDGYAVVDPEITGSAYVVAKHTFLLDPDDPVHSFDVST